MPKVTVYIPDQLWKRIKAGPTATNVSQLVQKALETELGLGAPAPETEKSRDIVARMRREAQAIFKAGAQAGMDLAAELSWPELALLQEVGWDVDKWLEEDGDAAGPEGPRLADLLEQWRSDHDREPEDYASATSWKTGSYKEGWLDALRGVWGAVMSDLRNPDERGMPNE